MDIKEYIASGILEAYWAGELKEAEMQEVDRLAAIYPEIKSELKAIGHAINSYAQIKGQGPSQTIISEVLEGVSEDERSAFLKAVIDDDNEPEVIYKKVNVMPVWSIAASILLLISAGFNFVFFKEFQSSKEQLAAIEAVLASETEKKTVLANLANEQKLELQYADLRIAHFLNKDNIHVRMDGLSLSPQAFANVFWNVKSNAVFISVDNLPTPPHGHQYQLWAIKAGQAPIDAGIFDHSQLIQELKVIKGNVQAFAVTLEKKGGSPVATVEKTYVKGFLKKS